MIAAPTGQMVRPRPRRLLLPIALLLVGIGAVVRGLTTDPTRVWPNLLLDGFYFLSLGVGAMFFIATQRAVSARWSAGLRRIPEALMLGLPVAALLMVPLAFGRHALFPWAHPEALTHEPAIAGKTVYLSAPFVFARMAVVLALWVAFAWRFRWLSLAQDRNPSLAVHYHRRLDRTSALFIVLFALSLTTAAYDWLSSLDPGWFSTMFAVYVFAGVWVQGIAAVTLASLALSRRSGERSVALPRGAKGDRGAASSSEPPPREMVSDHHLHDLGKLLFAFSIFWAYIWTCQYLLIWYGDIPEEVTHYVKRTGGPWLGMFAINFAINFVVPFLALLSAPAKRNRPLVATVCGLVLLGRWLDLYLIIMPSLVPAPHLGSLEVLIAVGYGALIYLLFHRNLAKAPLVPLHDPVLAADGAPVAQRPAA